MLRVEGLVAGYGLIRALNGVSLAVGEGEFVAVIGPNGAGKTTLMRSLMGLLKSEAGAVEFAGRAIAGWPSEAIVELGMALVPEGRHVFQPLTVRDNLQLGGYLRLKRGDRRAVADDLARVFALFPRLEERAGQLAGSLSGGEQQMLAIGRALMAKPKLLLLDEPSMGLAPIIVAEIFRTFARLREAGTTILISEQNARMALNSADRAYVLESGEVVKAAPAAALLRDPAVMAAYLGR
ncbi:MAG TPA: ABC transporter ATP-binding protein [Alphaproteobacteria bacterium]|jgi:branched-chain amino acid transport system ATP-binding protein|nr:ABC transporter ATP-binding protein [Alphaproteobacteria bacterium]